MSVTAGERHGLVGTVIIGWLIGDHWLLVRCGLAAAACFELRRLWEMTRGGGQCRFWGWGVNRKREHYK